MKVLKIILITIMLPFISSEIQAQYLRAVTGTDIPMQYLLGLNYQQGKYFSAEASIGYVGIPYNGDLYKVINVPEKHQSRKEFLMETTDDGYVLGLGANGHYKKWYGGVFIQRLELHASATYEYIMGSELFQQQMAEDERILLNAFLSEDINLGSFADVDLTQSMRLTTVATQMGLKVGRRFMFKNPRWEFRVELGVSRNIQSNTESEYDEELFDNIQGYYNTLIAISKVRPDLIEYYENLYNIEIPLDLEIDELLNFEQKEDELDDWFHQYAIIPTLNLRLTYLIFVPKKVKDKQKAADTPPVE